MMTPNIGRPLLEFHNSGKVRILAIASQSRIKAAPGLPTATEAGLPGMVATTFNGLFVPAGVPREIVDELAQVTRNVLADADVQSSLVRSGFDPQTESSPEAADSLVAEELQKWLPIVKTAGFSMR